MKYVFKIVIHALLTLSSVAAWQIRPRVVGGVPDVGHEFPFAVMLQVIGPPAYRICSGSLIAPTWVLTAGHCIPNVAGFQKYTRVKYGDPTIPSNETKSLAKIIKATRHPGFRERREKYMCGIGIMKIERVSNTPHVKLSAVDYVALMGLPVKYAGFGMTKLLPKGEDEPKNIDEEDMEPPFLVGEAVVVSCKQDGGLSSASPSICVAPRCGPRQQAYYGDSGGPLVFNGRIIGVTSGFAYPELPILGYTPVSPYLEWIYDTIHLDQED